MAEESSNDEGSNYEHFESISEIEIQAPIVGYEVVDARKRFTVYQINVSIADGKSWYVFRRYSDFARLDENLRKIFPDLPESSLPPKRYLGDNFCGAFIEIRKAGLQVYLDRILSRNDIANSQPVIDFLCLDDPPGPYDSIEESRAFIENLEDTIGDLRSRHNDLRTELKMARAQLRQAQSQRRALLVALRAERVLNGKPAYDDNDIALISEYSGIPEVKNLDLTKFGRDDDTISRRSWRYRSSTTGSQWDLTIESSSNALNRSRPVSLCSSMKATSTPDMTKPPSSTYKRRPRHLPSDEKGSALSGLDKFMRHSTEALHQIRKTVREKLGTWESDIHS